MALRAIRSQVPFEAFEEGVAELRCNGLAMYDALRVGEPAEDRRKRRRA